MLLNYLLAVLTGALLVLLHPRFELTLLAPFAVAPLIYALGREWRPLHRFLLGYAAGLTYWAGVNYWIHFVITVHGALGPVLGTVGFVLFTVLRAIPLGLFGLLGGVLVQRPFALIGVSALWVAIERMPWLFHYTWLHLGNAGINMSVPMRLAPFTGVYGLSFVFAMLGVAVALVALRRPRVQLRYLLILAFVYAFPAPPDPEPPKNEAVAVQPSIPDHDNWTSASAQALQKQMDNLSAQSALRAGDLRPGLILWPEVPAPLYYYDDAEFRDRVNALARLTRTPILIGTVARTEKGAPLNSALLISPDGHAAGRYDKLNLVPFGEYIPFPFSGMLATIASEAGEFVPGRDIVVFETAAGHGVGAFICYESAFPSEVRRFTAAGANVLVNLTNDGYFGGGAAREQHLNLARMRAAENRRWVLRATNDGITASIDPAGRVVKTFPSYKVMSGRLPYTPKEELTFYVRFGDLFAWSCAGIAVLLLIMSQVPSYRRG